MRHRMKVLALIVAMLVLVGCAGKEHRPSKQDTEIIKHSVEVLKAEPRTDCIAAERLTMYWNSSISALIMPTLENNVPNTVSLNQVTINDKFTKFPCSFEDVGLEPVNVPNQVNINNEFDDTSLMFRGYAYRREGDIDAEARVYMSYSSADNMTGFMIRKPDMVDNSITAFVAGLYIGQSREDIENRLGKGTSVNGEEFIAYRNNTGVIVVQYSNDAVVSLFWFLPYANIQ